jgi:hypothetical protein
MSCEHHPVVTAVVVVLPNTPKYGKGLQANAAFESNIEEVVEVVNPRMMTYGGLVN